MLKRNNLHNKIHGGLQEKFRRKDDILKNEMKMIYNLKKKYKTSE